MILGEVEKIEFHPRVGERHTLAVRTYDATPFGQSTRRERLGNAGLRDVVVLDTVKNRIQARLHASVGGMGVDFEDQIGFGSELRCEHGMSECVDRTTEVAHANLFLLSVSNFSCTIDAFTHSMLASELGSKPYLILEIDAHTADAGVQTRLEAFLDIVQNYHVAQTCVAQSFAPCRLAKGGSVICSNGECVPLTDPRVKLYFLNFSQYHAQSMAMATGWLGLHAGEVI